MAAPEPPPLSGLLVVDASRMLPGGVAARMLLDLGARLVKVESPKGGDPMRLVPPLVNGIGTGFCVHFRGAESIRLDLREEADRALLRRLLDRADVFLESFRPGTLERYGLPLDAVLAERPRLVACSLPAYPEGSGEVGHDLGFVAETGLLERLGRAGEVPRVQIADTMAAVLAVCSILAALVGRDGRTRGVRIEQPLVSGALPLLSWAQLDRALGSIGMQDTLLAGRVPAYRTYACADERLLAVACLEPKFFTTLCERLGCPELAAAGLDLGERGRAASARLATIFGEGSTASFLARLADLPVTLVATLAEAAQDPKLGALVESLPLPDGRSIDVPGTALALGLPLAHHGAAPRLGAHDESIRRELGAPGELDPQSVR